MGSVKGFLNYDRKKKQYEHPETRKNHFKEFSVSWAKGEYEQQASRCMDCGVPFCQSGCPLGNKIPDFNDAVYNSNWKEAWRILKTTNNFPEFTGRICPAPCEASCVLGLNNQAVNIEHIEKEISEMAFREGWESPFNVKKDTGKKIAIIGSGPAGLAAAEELRKLGHSITVFERDQEPGGLLRYGIPDFKLEKRIIERRIALLQSTGIDFKTGIEVGKDISTDTLNIEFDATVLCIGATVPRDLAIPGNTLNGVHFAMDFLKQQNQLISGEFTSDYPVISAKGKRVVVIGGGDTGADCLGTSVRQGAESIIQIELMDKPPLLRAEANPWPEWPMVISESTSHQEGGKRDWALLTKRFIGENGRLTGIETVRIEWQNRHEFLFTEVPGSTQIVPCDLALIAIGFSGAEKGLAEEFGLKLDSRSNIESSGYNTSKANVFAAGDCRRGQSLIVWAIAEGRRVAKAANVHLQLSVSSASGSFQK